VATKSGETVLNANLIGIAIAGLLIVLAALGYPSLRRWQQRRAAVARREGGA